MKRHKDVLSHLDLKGRARMVNVSSKMDTARTAAAHALISMNESAFTQVMANKNKKGDVFGTANLAGIMAAKKTSELIPLCHPLDLSHVELEFRTHARSHSIEIIATCKHTGKTGVEMEALMAVAVAALTLYDMCKAVDRSMIISEIYLNKKSGGRSGIYRRKTK